jgi:hypothetical protein
MEYHEVCTLFPLMTADERRALTEDIARNGQREPIRTYEGKIIDGRNRYEACCALHVAPTFEEWSGQGSLVAYVVSLNLHRRHLDTSQRAAIAAEVKPILEEEGRERMRAAGRKSAPGRPAEKGCADLHNLSDDDHHDSLQQAADMVNVSRRIVADAELVKEQAPERFEAIKRGETTVHAERKQLTERNGHAKPRKEPERVNVIALEIEVGEDPKTYYQHIARGLLAWAPKGQPLAELIAALQALQAA